MVNIMNQYSDEEFAKIVQESETYMQISNKLGYSSIAGDSFRAIKKRIEELHLNVSHLRKNSEAPTKRDVDNIFIKNSTAAQSTLRRWYIKGNYTPYICSICGMKPEWQGKPLTLILDHINGENHDDRLENLRWVCPNCNQQLPTTGYKKKTASEKKNFCIDCGVEISAKAVRCKSCNVIYQKNRDFSSINRADFKQAIRTMPLAEAARKFTISTNELSTWCKHLGLPNTKREINKYTDEEWEKI